MRYQLPRFLFFLFSILLLVAAVYFGKIFFLESSSSAMLNIYRPPGLRHHLNFRHEEEVDEVSLANPSLGLLDEEFTSLVSHIIPSVVSIITTDVPSRDELLRQFFRFSNQQQSPDNKMGSGMIASSQGDIITNWHVIKDASEVIVQLNDGRMLSATLTGFDERADIAVLKIHAEGLVPISLGDSDDVKVGQLVVAVGNPFGLQETVTQGIISAKGRRAISEAVNEFFQTSTLINPGNSGGPLVDIHGNVIGINNFIISRSGGAEGLSFAIPSNVARRVYNDIMEHGRVIRPWFGVVMRPLNDVLALQLGLHNKKGALVAATLPGSPAEQAGLKPGDLITTFNGRLIKDWIDLRNRIAEAKTGEEALIRLERHGSLMELRVKIQEEPSH
ncbi:MAG: S1C family serine protease [Chthoniobacterales bacterium]